MSKRYLIPFALILLLLLAACSGAKTAEVSQAEVAASQSEMAEESQDSDMDAMEDENNDDEMAEENLDDDMDEMAGESLDDDMDAMEGEGRDDDAMADESHDDDMDEEGQDDDMDMDMEDDGGMAEESMDDAMSAANLPAWQTIALANAATGEQFTLGDFQGKTVFVEPMATWCSNCRAQQGHVGQAKTQLGDDVVFIGLSLETNLPSGDLANYAAGNGFDWTYAVMPVELLEQLSDQFGRSITSAPSTPHFIIRPDGSFTELATGIHSADEIISEIQAEQG